MFDEFLDMPLTMKAFFCFLLLCLAAVIYGFYLQAKVSEQFKHDIVAMGYNIEDVKVYLKRVNLEIADFSNSQSLRLEYEKYKKGEIALQAKPESNNGGSLATGLALGMVLGSSAGRK